MMDKGNNFDYPQKEPVVIVPEVVDPIPNASGLPFSEQARNATNMEVDGGGGGSNTMSLNDIPKGEKQALQFRDVPFAVAFAFQFVLVFGTAGWYGPAAFADTTVDTTPTDDDYDVSTAWNTLSNLIALFVGASVLTMMALEFMIKNAHRMVQISFFMAPSTFVLAAVMVTLLGSYSLAPIFLVAAVIMSIISVCFYWFFKSQFAFAAANLHSALRGLQLNTGLYLLSLGTSIVGMVWSLVWFVALFGLQTQAGKEEEVPCSDLGLTDDVFHPNGSMCQPQMNPFAFLALLLSLFWTQQVLQNVLHTTTAGTIGEWWINPMGDRSCCSQGITSSLHRSMTYSFGSICFGSLLVAVIQVLESMARNARHNNRNALLMCVIQCLLSILRSLLEYVNSWAFVYVGLYNYDYMTAGRKVMNLFRHRGWTTYISDRLVYRVLMLCHLSVAILTGTFGIILGLTTTHFDADDRDAVALGYFFLGFVIGLLISSTALYVVESAVRTVIVCFAENPQGFQDHHPDLYDTMRVAWFEAYPVADGGASPSSGQTSGMNNNGFFA